jgi:NRAMP (natural resistance-associated macrophage protein)-like metal ion transporter
MSPTERPSPVGSAAETESRPHPSAPTELRDAPAHPPREHGARREPLLWRALKKGWYAIGPGFITGASDDDPSGIATYSQTGAQYGYGLLWTSTWQIPLLYYTQEAVARIGAVRGKGLASAIREQYGLPLAVVLAASVVVADTINAGADIGAVAGSAHLVLPIDSKALIALTTTLVLVLVVFVGYRRYANVLKVLGLFLLAYLITAFAVAEPWGEVLKSTFVPHIELTTSFLFLTVGTFGTTITAYCWFWQSDQEVEEQLADRMIGPDGKVDEQRLGPFLKGVKTDTKIGTAWAEVVQWAIIVVCATVLFRHGVTNITTAAQAASALKPFAGEYAKDLFAIGVVGVGLMAIPIFAGVSAYAMCELNGWSKGLDRKVKDARPFYAVIIVSTLIAEVMNFAGINMIKALVWTAVIWGFVAVPLLFAIGRLNSDPKVLGDRRGTRGSRIWVWITFGVMTLSAIALLVSLI